MFAFGSEIHTIFEVSDMEERQGRKIAALMCTQRRRSAHDHIDQGENLCNLLTLVDHKRRVTQ